jgi:hypothetical protein
MKIAERNDQREEKRREEKRREEKRREEKGRILFAGKAGIPFRDITKESPFRLEAQGNQSGYVYSHSIRNKRKKTMMLRRSLNPSGGISFLRRRKRLQYEGIGTDFPAGGCDSRDELPVRATGQSPALIRSVPRTWTLTGAP